VYDATGNIVATVDQLGRRTTYSYDLLDRNTQTKDALGNLVTTVYDSAGNVSASVDQLGRRTTYSYDALNRQTQAQDALGNLSTTLYDAVGNVTVEIDALGHRTTSSFDALNRNTLAIDATGATITTAYDATSDQISTTNPDSATTTYSFDGLRRATLTQDSLGDLTTTVFDALGDVTETDMQATGTVVAKIKDRYDALGRLTTSVDANGNTSTTVYDAAGNVTNSIDAGGNKSTFAYDALNRRTAVTDPAGDLSTTLYDAIGNVTARIDGLGHVTTYVYDLLNRTTQTSDARGGIVTTLYDAIGNNTTVVDQVGNTTTMAFDALNRLTQQTDPLNHSGTMAYDAIGRQTSATDRDGQVINTTYDNDGRVLTQVWKNSAGTTVNTLTYSYDNAGNQLTAASSSGAYTMSYDALNRATLTQEPFGVTLTSTYDALSRRTLLQDSFGGVTTSTYDLAGNLTDRSFSGTNLSNLDASLTYTVLNQLSGMLLNSPSPTGSMSFSYDAAGRLTHLQDLTFHNTNISHYTYVYDAASRLTSETRNGATTTYQYDTTNELTNDTAHSYSYDLAGNRMMTGYTTGAANELTNDGMWTYSYDNNGNMTKKSKGATAETWYFGYDNANRMTSAIQEQTDGGTLLMQATYVYDVLGNRIEKDVWTSSSGTVVTRFAYDGQNAFADLNSSNQFQMRWLYGDAVDQLFAREDSSGNVAWYLTDRLGSVRDVISPLAAVLDHIDYDGFGNATESNPTNGDRYKWTGRELDSETQLQFNRARYYTSATGRWTSQDPLGVSGPDADLYRYAGNGCPNVRDPNGLLGIFFDGSGNIYSDHTVIRELFDRYMGDVAWIYEIALVRFPNAAALRNITGAYSGTLDYLYDIITGKTKGPGLIHIFGYSRGAVEAIMLSYKLVHQGTKDLQKRVDVWRITNHMKGIAVNVTVNYLGLIDPVNRGMTTPPLPPEIIPVLVPTMWAAKDRWKWEFGWLVLGTDRIRVEGDPQDVKILYYEGMTHREIGHSFVVEERMIRDARARGYAVFN
jgi:RHS repeat-associated protein